MPQCMLYERTLLVAAESKYGSNDDNDNDIKDGASNTPTRDPSDGTSVK